MGVDVSVLELMNEGSILKLGELPAQRVQVKFRPSRESKAQSHLLLIHEAVKIRIQPEDRDNTRALYSESDRSQVQPTVVEFSHGLGFE